MILFISFIYGAIGAHIGIKATKKMFPVNPPDRFESGCIILTAMAIWPLFLVVWTLGLYSIRQPITEETASDMMEKYPKINSLYMRDKEGRLQHGHFARPEFELLAGIDWLWTEKVDGTNIRLGYEPHSFRGNEIAYIAGRTDNAQIPSHLLQALMTLQREMPWEEQFDCPVTLYGEGYGPKIQKGGGNYGDAPRFVLFDVKIGRWWLDYEDVVDVGDKLGLRVVPLLFRGPITRAEHTVVSPSFTSTWGDFRAEGVVGRPATTLFNKRGERVLCKIKVKDYDRISPTTTNTTN